mgnify:CR=1 FL=1
MTTQATAAPPAPRGALDGARSTRNDGGEPGSLSRPQPATAA